MAPIFLTGVNTVSIPAFRERGLNNKGPAELDSLNVFTSGVVSHKYTWTIKNMPTVIQAQITNTSIQVLSNTIGVFQTIQPKTFDVPSTSLNFPNASDQDKILLESYGMRFDTARKCFIGSPSFSNYGKILMLGPSATRFNPGTVNQDGYLAYMFLMKGLAMYTTVSNLIHIGGRKENLFMPKNGVLEGGSAASIIGCGADENSRFTKQIPAEQIFANEIYATEYVSWDSAKEKSIDIITVSPRGKLLTTKKGLFFPYFHGMVLPDKNIAWHTFFQIFGRCLNADIEITRKLASRIRTGIRNFAA